MLRKVIGTGGLLLLIAALVFATPGTAQAQRWHGGGWGGYHGGYYGGYGWGHPGYGYGWGGYGWGHPYYGGWGYGYYPGYSSWNYGSPYAYWQTYPSYAAYSYPASSYESFYYSPSASNASGSNVARVLVRVPADARLFFNDQQMTSTGPMREFVTPPLTADKKNAYDIRATWMDNGREVTQTKTIDVTPGSSVRVEFPMASAIPPTNNPGATSPGTDIRPPVPGQTSPTPPVKPDNPVPNTIRTPATPPAPGNTSPTPSTNPTGRPPADR